MSMNTPNKLTVARMIATPIFMAIMLIEAIPFRFLISLVLFAAASLTDMIDGKMARKYNLVTDFGKFLDPLADKILVFSALIAFIEMDLASSVAIVIMMAREFLVTSLRLVASDNGTVIAASKLGKLKTAMTMASIVIILCILSVSQFVPFVTAGTLSLISNTLIWIATAITLLSGAEYLIKNKEHFLSDK